MPDITNITPEEVINLLASRGQTRYPTKEEILSRRPTYKKGLIPLIREFKGEWLRQKKENPDFMATHEARFQLLSELLTKLSALYNKPLNHVSYEENAPSCYYQSATQTIAINRSLSIISTLHEFAHHIHGHSETRACRWSVHLFKEIFPKAYNRLEWQGHLLVKPRRAQVEAPQPAPAEPAAQDNSAPAA